MGDEKIYRSTDAKGRVTYGDRPPMPEPGTETYVYDHRAVEKAIKIVRRSVPKWLDYLDYLDTLRHYNSYQFERALRTLSTLDEETYRKVLNALQRAPSVRDALAHAVTDGMSGPRGRLPPGAVVRGAREGKILRQWLAGTVHHMLKRSNPSAEQRVLARQLEELHGAQHNARGAARQGLSSTPYHDKGREILKTETRLNEAGNKAQHGRDMRAIAKNVNASRAAAVSRLGGVILEFVMKLLDVETWNNAHSIMLDKLIQRLVDEKVITIDAQMRLWQEKRQENGPRVVAEVLRLIATDIKQGNGKAEAISDVSEYLERAGGVNDKYKNEGY